MPRLMLLVAIVACVGLFSIPVFGQTDVEIPSWVKGVANFWVEDKINDGEFAEALEFLIDSNIIQLGDAKIMSDPVVEENPFGIEEDNRTLEEKHAETVAYLDKQMKDQKEMYEKQIMKMEEGRDREYAEYRENQHILSEENTKLQLNISDLEKENFQLKIDIEKK